MKCQPITIICAKGETFVLPAWPVLVPHLCDWQWVVHKAVNASNDWVVSELSTGFNAISPEDECESLEEAVNLAQHKLAGISVEKCAAAIAKAKAHLATMAARH